VSQQDLSQEEQKLVFQWLANGYLTEKEKIYKFHSKYRAGTLGLVQKGSAYLHVIGENIKDLYIDAVGNAAEGDLVIAKRLLGKRGTPSATIAVIVGKQESFSVAYILQKDTKRSLVDLKTDYPIGVELAQNALLEYRPGDCFKINNQQNSIMEYLGNLDDPKVDEKIVLAQFNKHDAFEEDVLEIARSFKEVDASKYPKRKDLRHLDFCTIDPVTAKDFDDAIYWDEKNSTLYVAIADVSEYVTPFGALDNEAIYRSFSIYLPHRSIPMLPRELSETLCSLQPNVDRLAYVFEMQLDLTKLEVTNSEVYEALIHSKRRFNYEEIDAFFQKKLKTKNNLEERIITMLEKLKTVTDRLKHERLKVGFEFHSTEIEMQLDANTNLIATKEAQETPSHALIEDCMLLANKEAAKRYERGIFRIHEAPSQSKLQSLYQELSAIGITIEIKNTIRETIVDIQRQARDMGIESEVDTLIIRAQMQARYAPLNSGHFGLGFDAYTHFTSPIRRYSDLIVHRLLKAIAKGDTKEGSYVLRNIETLTMTISEKEREASTIEVEYKARKYARWAATQLNREFKAKITATEPQLLADLDDTIVGAKLYITNNEDVVLFEKVKVKIERVDIARAKIYVAITGKITNV
jgi:ribonuclease R